MNGVAARDDELILWDIDAIPQIYSSTPLNRIKTKICYRTISNMSQNNKTNQYYPKASMAEYKKT